ncbi:hypothetical protein BB561_001458 [Smittium simulii]|uniref:Large ribosomal subunit protein bL21m n=1 Tax=Smittium simulii TaxID=133385 RepID=A0A2T9YUG9_9FUNG|nr:hypothetical protein BB561_001458 [Smittium simulii]
MLSIRAFAQGTAAKAFSAATLKSSCTTLFPARQLGIFCAQALGRREYSLQTKVITKPAKNQQTCVTNINRQFSSTISTFSSIENESVSSNSVEIPAEAVTNPSFWDPESKKLLNMLSEQQEHYVTVVIKGKKFTVTKRDIIVMDRLNDLSLGDVISLNLVTELGSKDFTITGSPYVNENLFQIEATIIEHPETEVITTFKKKRRKGYQRTYHHEHRRTLLRISKLEVFKID